MEKNSFLPLLTAKKYCSQLKNKIKQASHQFLEKKLPPPTSQNSRKKGEGTLCSYIYEFEKCVFVIFIYNTLTSYLLCIDIVYSRQCQQLHRQWRILELAQPSSKISVGMHASSQTLDPSNYCYFFSENWGAMMDYHLARCFSLQQTSWGLINVFFCFFFYQNVITHFC